MTTQSRLQTTATHKVLRIKHKGKITHFHQLLVWQVSKELVLHVYSCSSQFPKEETFGLTSQIKRASISILSNIAEGFGRISPKEKVHFYSIARGSLDEVECQLIIAHELDMLSDFYRAECSELCSDIRNMLNSLIKKIQTLHT